MIRHYLISENIEDVTRVERELLEMGLHESQIQVLSNSPQLSDLHRVKEVDSLSRRDIIHSGLIGAGIGLALAVVILAVGLMYGAHNAETWLPFAFLAFVVTCFGAWEGGLFGIQVSNVQFRKLEKFLRDDKFVLLVDVKQIEDEEIKALVKRHPELRDGGYGKPRSDWALSSEKNIKSFVKALP